MKWRVILEPDPKQDWAVWCPELLGLYLWLEKVSRKP